MTERQKQLIDGYRVATDSGRNIDSGWHDIFRGFRMGHLYDNKVDCKNMEHEMFDDWEKLRKIQLEEGYRC